MKRLLPLLLSIPLCGCGLAGTAISGAGGAASEAKQAEAAHAQLEQAKQDMETAQRTAEAQRELALKEAGQ